MNDNEIKINIKSLYRLSIKPHCRTFSIVGIILFYLEKKLSLAENDFEQVTWMVSRLTKQQSFSSKWSRVGNWPGIDVWRKLDGRWYEKLLRTVCTESLTSLMTLIPIYHCAYMNLHCNLEASDNFDYSHDIFDRTMDLVFMPIAEEFLLVESELDGSSECTSWNFY